MKSAASQSGGSWPEPQHELLLRAALLDRAPSVDALRQLERQVDLDHLDSGANRLLPLLYRALRRHGLDHPWLGRLKGVYRYTWTQNQLLFYAATRILGALREAGIPTLALKGMALTFGYYRDAGLRPMEDIDVLVPRAQAEAACAVVRDLGWRADTPLFDRRLRQALAFRHAQTFVNGRGQACDLHWSLFNTLRQPGADDVLWADAIPLQVGDESALTLNPTDSLMHICAHGAYWNPTPPVRWVADALTVLQAAPVIDWDRLLRQARLRRLTLPLADTLPYLRDRMDAAIPEWVIVGLRQTETTQAERREYAARLVNPIEWGVGLTFWLHYRQWRRSPRDPALPAGLRGYLAFIELEWNAERLGDLPRIAADKAAYRLRQRRLQGKS